jgi:hypothetical protein
MENNLFKQGERIAVGASGGKGIIINIWGHIFVDIDIKLWIMNYLSFYRFYSVGLCVVGAESVT